MRIFEKTRYEKETGEKRDWFADELAKHANNPWAFAHFSNVSKLGINPNVKEMSSTTPLGIYSYPLQAMFERISRKSVPFGHERRYIVLFEVRPEFRGSIMHIGKNEEMNDPVMVEKLIDLARQASLLDFPYEKGGLRFSDLYAIVRDHFHANRNEREGLGKGLVAWNSFFRNAGIEGIVDWGKGEIHSGEPMQAVFFSSRPLLLLTIIDTDRGREASKSAHKRNEIINKVVSPLQKRFDGKVIVTPGPAGSEKVRISFDNKDEDWDFRGSISPYWDGGWAVSAEVYGGRSGQGQEDRSVIGNDDTDLVTVWNETLNLVVKQSISGDWVAPIAAKFRL